MRGLQEIDAKTLHEIMQPLNIIRLSCGNIRARMAGYSAEDAEYLIAKLMRIEEQVVRATELLQDLKTRNEDGTSVEGV
jgi:nitrogen fixation/metabolism regulation signal transduction histidine kinase